MIESTWASPPACSREPRRLVDLDGFLLLAADPFSGLERVDDLLIAPSAPGLGVEPSATA